MSTKAPKSKMKTYTLDEVKDKHLGKKGTAERDRFEQDLQLALIGGLIRESRLQRKLTQEELGRLVGVQKAQISKLENNGSNVTIDTILRVFAALKAKVNFSVELSNKKVRVA